MALAVGYLIPHAFVDILFGISIVMVTEVDR